MSAHMTKTSAPPPLCSARPVIAGVPLRYKLSDFDIWAAADGTAVLDADLPECPGSHLAGRCAFTSLMDAGRTCSLLADCKSVNVFWNGARGMGVGVVVLCRRGNRTLWPNGHTASLQHKCMWWLPCSAPTHPTLL